MEEINKTHSRFMESAIDKAWKYQLLTYPNPAVGATVVKDSKILSIGAHEKAGSPHAEVLALKEAYLTKYPNSELKNIEDSHGIHNYLYENHNNFFKTCEIYVTLEPCNHTGKTPACAMLLENVGIKKVYIGTLDPNNEASGGLQRLQNAGIEVVTNVCSDKTDELLYPFVKWQKDRFIFFKIAMREDGSVTGGYITSQDSLNLVHEIRTKINTLVIGGQTVRVDRPTLDARFAKENISPNIEILSREKEFDKTIKLFNIPNREVKITDKFDMENKNFVMVEGGYNLLELLKEKIDYLMLFISHKEKFENQFDYETIGFKKIYSYMLNDIDEIIYLRK